MTTQALFRRRRRYRHSARRVQAAARRVLRRRGDNLSEEEREALLAVALNEEDSAYILSEEAEYDDVGGDARDWGTFFEALASFLERILPMILDLIKQLIPLFAGAQTDPATA